MTDHESIQTDRAALLQSVDVLSDLAKRNQIEDLQVALAALSEKLERNRFNLAVLGQMKRGKSSFINALLGAEILPTGILPLTSVITRVTYGPVPTATIFYNSGRSESIEVPALREYITEAANPGNRKQVAAAEVTYSAGLLRMGIDLIDTPGIGSTHSHNTSTTEDYLSEVDAGIVVLSVDPPITAVELQFLRRVHEDIPRLLFVINKADMVMPSELETIRRFLERELRNRIGIESPELFPLSARQAMREQLDPTLEKSSGLEQLAARLHYFASKERERTLLQSIGLDLLRIANTLRFTALIGERARAMRGEDLEKRKQLLEAALAKSDQEFKDLRHLLRQDAASIVAQVEADLKDHVAAAKPGVREQLTRLRQEHPTETRLRLGELLDRFLGDEVAATFDGWCTREDEYIQKKLAELSDRFVERTNTVLERLQQAAGALFDVPVSHVDFSSALTMESHLYYHTDPVFMYQLDKLIFILPKFLLRPIVFRRMLSYIDRELDRNSGRIRYDYVQRLEKSIAAFEQELKSAVSIVTDNLRRVLQSGAKDAECSQATVSQLDPIIAQCSSLLAGANLNPQFAETAGG